MIIPPCRFQFWMRFVERFENAKYDDIKYVTYLFPIQGRLSLSGL